MQYISIKTLQLFKTKLAYFFIILFSFILITASTAAATDSNFITDYSGSRLVPIYQVQRDDQKIALTIDGAWGSNQTKSLLKLFKKEEITVSFFFAGIWLENNPKLVKEIIKAGHQIHNHSYSHPHLNNLSKNKIRNELLKTEAIINNFQSSDSGIKLFRSPYGEYNNLVIRTARELGYQVVQWSLDSHDWMNPGKKYIINRIKNNVNSGDILLFHNNSNNVDEILAELIPQLKKSYQFVKIEELIYNNNYQIDSFTGLQSIKKDGTNEN